MQLRSPGRRVGYSMRHAKSHRTRSRLKDVCILLLLSTDGKRDTTDFNGQRKKLVIGTYIEVRCMRSINLQNSLPTSDLSTFQSIQYTIQISILYSFSFNNIYIHINIINIVRSYYIICM